MKTIKPSQLVEILLSNVHKQVPIFIWGQPGIGKSDISKQVARRLGMSLVDIRLLYKDPVDLRGLPRVTSDGIAEWVPPADLPFRAVRAKQKGERKPVLLFLDELPQAPPMVQNTASQLVLDRRIGEHVLDDDVYIVAAGNRASDRAATFELPSHLANRFMHVELDVDFDDWKAWAYNNNINPRIMGFLSHNQRFLNQFDPAKKSNATPRAWEMMSKLMDGGEVYHDAVAYGVLGEVALEFENFQKVYSKIPNAEDLLNDPKLYAKEQKKQPNERWKPDQLYAMIANMIFLLEEKWYEGYLDVMEQMPEEYKVLAIKDALQKTCAIREDTLSKAPNFTRVVAPVKDLLSYSD